MRKRFRILLLAAIVAAAIVPFGFALSMQTAPRTPRSSQGVLATTSAVNAAGALVRPGDSSHASILRPMPDWAALFVAGAVLFGVAAAVRKTILS
jgi:hypothetical protein